jgi:hypothetical protein
MILSEITEREPLLISTMRKLMAKGDRIWLRGSFALLEVRKIGKVVVDHPRTMDSDEYHGPAYSIDVHGGIGVSMTPDEAETRWTLEKTRIGLKTEDAPDDWELKRVRNG